MQDEYILVLNTLSGGVSLIDPRDDSVVIGDVATLMAFHSKSCCKRSVSLLPRRAARYTDSGRTPNGSASCLPLRPNHSIH